MSLYNKSGGKIPEITAEERLKVLLTNAFEIYAEAHSDRYNSRGEFLELLYGSLGRNYVLYQVMCCSESCFRVKHNPLLCMST